MIQNLYGRPFGSPLLQSAIFQEIIGSQSTPTHMVIEELGLAMSTHPGAKRARNEDRIAVARIDGRNRETYTTLLVCDGVGGSESGDQAAALAITSIIVDLTQQQEFSSLEELAIALIRRADDLVRKELHGLGETTLVMLLAKGDGEVVCASVGDSRAYSWDTSLNKLDQVTIDDTVENDLKDLPGNPAALIKARGLQGRLSQAIGESGRTSGELRIQMYPRKSFHLGAVLGSDGLWRAAKDFETVVARAPVATDAVRRAITIANWVGGVDNASIIAVEDVGRLCGDQQRSYAPAGGGQAEVTLWLSSSKVKILGCDGISDTKPVEMRGKSERPKKNVKRAVRRKGGGESQLELGVSEIKEPRPKIEVTISEEPEKKE